MFKEFVNKNKDNIIDTISNLIKFNSVSIETADTSMPFGKECKEALEYTLTLAENMGFRTKNIDGLPLTEYNTALAISFLSTFKNVATSSIVLPSKNNLRSFIITMYHLLLNHHLLNHRRHLI